MVISAASEAGKIIGEKLVSIDNYKQDFIETEEVTDLNLVGTETINSTEDTTIVYKKSIIGCAELPFVIDHPVHGNIDSSTYYIDGNYCSIDISEQSGTAITFIVSEDDTYITDEDYNFIIA